MSDDAGNSLVRAGHGYQVQGGSGAPAPVEYEAGYPRAGIGRTPSTLSDRRDPNARLVTGGRIDELFDEAWFMHPMSSSVRVKREGPMLRIAIPGDRGEWLFDEVTGDDGVKYWACLDGTAPFFPGAPDDYHPDVGESMGTLLLPPEPYPHLNARELGSKKRSGDVSILSPIVWHKRRHAPGNAVGQGGAVLVRKVITTGPDSLPGAPSGPPSASVSTGITVKDAANNRHLARTLLEELHLEIIGGALEQVPLVEGPGWTPALIFWHEQLQLDPAGNGLLGATGPSFELGDITLDNVIEWLDFNPGQLSFSGSDCVLEPLTLPGRVNLRRLSYQCGIAANTEIAERIAESLMIVDENSRRAHRVAVGVSKCACAIKQAFIDDGSFAADYPALVRKLAAITCPCGCEGASLGAEEAVETEEDADGSGGGSGGGGGGGGGAPAGTGWGSGATGGTPPPGSVFGPSTPAPGGGTLTPWTASWSSGGFTGHSSGTWFTPAGGTPPTGLGTGTPSDRRLKENLRQIGTRHGLAVYEWTWNAAARAAGFGDLPTVGHVAQDVREVCPVAVLCGEDGWLRVDYAVLEHEAQRLGATT